MLEFSRSYPVSLYSTSVYTVDYVNESKRLWKVLFNNVVHNGRLTNTRTFHYYDSLLKRT